LCPTKDLWRELDLGDEFIKKKEKRFLTEVTLVRKQLKKRRKNKKRKALE
jgi:hypothetical protein